MVGGGWGPTFSFFKPLDNNMAYTLGIHEYVYIRDSVQNNFFKGLIFVITWRPDQPQSKSPF